MFSELTVVSDYDYDAPNFHEYYNVTTDQYQLTNTWDSLSTSEQQTLLASLHSVWHCTGDDCP